MTKDLIDLLQTERGTFQEWDYTGTVEALPALDPAKYQGPTQFLRHGEDPRGRLLIAAKPLARVVVEPGNVLAKRYDKSL